jgi:hypothetical protein
VRIAAVTLLLVYAAAVSAAGTRWLPRAAWPLRAPRAGIAAWLAGALSVATAVAAAGLILAVELAAHSDLRVSVITYEDGTEELEVLHVGPPHRDENTIDRGKFADRARTAPDWTLCLAGESGIRNAMNLIRATLRNASAP